MRSRLAACLLVAGLLGIASPAHAVDVTPGDSCAGFNSGVYRPTGGAENPNGALVVCDGSVWQPILRYSSAGNAVMFSSTGLPAAPVHVWGEAIIGNQGLACGAAQEGAIRFNSAGAALELCDGSAWDGVGGGLWSDSGSGFIFYDSSLGAMQVAGVTGTPAPQYSSSSGDNLGDHTATQNILLNGNWLSNDGGNEGAFVDSAGNVGIGSTSPAVPLDVAGTMRAVDDAAGCTVTERGALRFNSAGGALEVCDGSAWGGVGGAPAAAGADRQIQFNSGGVFFASSGLVFDASGNVGIGDTSPDHMLDVAGNIGLAAAGYLNFGDTDGSGGYGIRDNAGTIECKDSGGSWAACAGGGSASNLGDLSDVAIAAGPDGSVLDSFAGPGSGLLGLTWDGSNLWHADYNDSTIYKLDPADGTVLDSFASPDAFPMGLAWDGTNLWNADTNTDTIYKLDPADGTVLDSFASPDTDPRGLTWDGTNLWHADAGTDTIYKLDPSDGTVLDSFASPGSASQGLTWDGSDFWIAGNGSDTIYQVDTSGNVLDSFASPGSTPRGLAWDGSNLWNADDNTDTIYKFGNSRSDGEILSYNKASGEWENQPPGSSGDNLGDHTATQNILLNGNWLSNDGGNEGVFVDTAGNVGIGTNSPQSKLDVNGEVQVGDSGASCTSSNEGAQRYNTTSKAMEYCDGASWGDLGGAGTPAGNDTEIQFNNSGSFGASPDLTFVNGQLRLGGQTGLPAPAMP